MSTADPYDLMRRLSPKAQAEVMRRRAAVLASGRQVWYCARGRACDGQPHDEYTYSHARADQYPPVGSWWDNWFHMSGRGTGKTRAGSNWVRKITSHVRRIALIGRTLTDVRQTMVEGPSGLIRECELAGETYDWKPALKEFTFQNGAKAFGWSAEEPNKLRGPEHGAGWLDEPCHWDFVDEVWSNYQLGLRQSGLPGGAKSLLTSSPLPIQWTKDRMADAGTVLVRVPTSINIANLDAGYIRRVIEPLMGTRRGRQELEAELLEDVEGALWQTELFQYIDPATRSWDRVVVGIDPAGSQGKSSDETGIIVAAKIDDGFYVLDDFTGKYSPAGWAAKAKTAYEMYQADAVVVERNYGGDMVQDTLRSHGYDGRVIEAKAVDGKRLRAEPIAALYEQGRGFHSKAQKPDSHGNLRGVTAELEDELVTWVPGMKSPNRLDAMVWCATELMRYKGSSQVSAGIPTGRSIVPQKHAQVQRLLAAISGGRNGQSERQDGAA